MHSPFRIVEMFEENLAEYTGAPYVVATTSCTTALEMCLKLAPTHPAFPYTPEVQLPKKTYVGVAQAVRNAGFLIDWKDREWVGQYSLFPLPIYDCARWLRADMYIPRTVMCLSFHWSKHLGIGQGGAILTDDKGIADELRRMRFDGRTQGRDPKEDKFYSPSYHAYMMPRDAAEGITRLALLPRDNEPLPNSDYPDLSKQECFR